VQWIYRLAGGPSNSLHLEPKADVPGPKLNLDHKVVEALADATVAVIPSVPSHLHGELGVLIEMERDLRLGLRGHWINVARCVPRAEVVFRQLQLVEAAPAACAEDHKPVVVQTKVEKAINILSLHVAKGEVAPESAYAKLADCSRSNLSRSKRWRAAYAGATKQAAGNAADRDVSGWPLCSNCRQEPPVRAVLVQGAVESLCERCAKKWETDGNTKQIG
jgi:hypothetical protein